MTFRAQLALACFMAFAVAADKFWIKPRRSHLDFIHSRDCAFEGKCWIK